MSNTALDQSIRHWIRIARGEGNSQGADNCQLCKEHYSKRHRCTVCPVYKKTNRHSCITTPYSEFMRLAAYYSPVYGMVGFTAYNAETKASAWDMARFLQSLKNEETPPWARPRCHSAKK